MPLASLVASTARICIAWCRGIPHSKFSGMGQQKTLDTFLTKRPRLSGPQPATTAAAAQQPTELESAAADSAKQPAAAAAATAREGREAEAASRAPAEPKGTAGPCAPIAADQIGQLQQLRSHANRNMALAKQVVIGCERVGTLPTLRDLLVEESWRDLLSDEFEKPYFRELEAFVQAEWRGTSMVFPPKDAVFRALNSCPVDQVKVVILGQDPYHDLGQAMGLSFSVPKDKAIPSSLRNIYKEIREDVGCDIPRHGNLEKWAQQGVLLLNAVLTVRAHQAGSHAKKGWERFTEAAISKLSQRRSGLVFLLWGRFAQDKERVICPNKHHVLKAAHPSGLSANRGFFGCRHFSKTNELLQKGGLTPIDWQIDP